MLWPLWLQALAASSAQHRRRVELAAITTEIRTLQRKRQQASLSYFGHSPLHTRLFSPVGLRGQFSFGNFRRPLSFLLWQAEKAKAPKKRKAAVDTVTKPGFGTRAPHPPPHPAGDPLRIPLWIPLRIPPPTQHLGVTPHWLSLRLPIATSGGSGSTTVLEDASQEGTRGGGRGGGGAGGRRGAGRGRGRGG